jgi:PAS domain S-box-containing protein
MMIAIAAAAAGLVALYVAFGAVALGRLHEAERGWLDHTRKATQIETLYTHIGYGGFIHNFKNFVLRGDRRYIALIDRDIAQLFPTLNNIDALFDVEEDRAALATIRATFTEYRDKYALARPMVDAGASPAQIDAVVKVADGPALAAFAALIPRIAERSQRVEDVAEGRLADAIAFLKIGGAVVILSTILGAAILIAFLNRLRLINEKLDQTRGRLDTLLDSSPDPMVCVDPAGRIVRTNRAAVELFGHRPEEMLGQSIELLIPGEFHASHTRYRQHYFDAPTNRPMGNRDMTMVALTRDGRRPIVEISLSHSGHGEDLLATATIRDVTTREESRRALEHALQELRQTQDTLVRSEKMAALGGLVAGIAHEINTPIGNVLSSASYFEAETGKVAKRYADGELSGDQLEDYFSAAQESSRLININVRKAADLVQGFKQVAVAQTGEQRRAFDLKTYRDEIVLSLRPRLKRTSHRITITCPEGLIIDSFPGALSQCISNLIINSLIHAFPEGSTGSMTITARQVGSNIELVYADDGIGIPEALHGKVFDPFFTTKRGHGGSGLGLHLLFNLVHQSLRGTLTLTSQNGQGAAFTLLFPAVAPAVAAS